MQVDGSLKNLLQGVSQQNRRDRLEGQCSEQINMLADVARDLLRRPHTEHLAELFSDSNTWKFHLHDSGDTQYLVFFGRADIKVYNLATGVAQTVVAPSYAYLAAAADLTLGQDLSTVTIGDYTMVANAKVTPAMEAALTANVSGAVVWVKLPALNSQAYKVYIDNTLAASYTAPASGTTGFGVNDIATALHTALVGSAFNATYTFTVFGEYVFIKKDDGTVETDISVTSDAGEDSIEIINNDVRDISDLSPYHFQNKIVKVSGDDSSSDNDFYMKYIKPNTNDSYKGEWRETLAAGLKYQVDTATVPHALIRTSTGTPDKFYFGELDGSTQDGVVIEDWLDRDAGDDDSNPLPPFIGEPITHVSQWQNRLVVLTGPDLLMSKTNSFFNFFNGSALTILDDDPIRLTNPSADYTIFYNTKAHNRHLLVFSDSKQFAVKGTSKVTPTNAALNLVSAYECDVKVADPFAIGASVLFPYISGNYVGIRDFITGQTVDQNMADSVTEHVRKYIKGNPLQIVGSANHNLVLVRTDDDLATLYTYQVLWQGGERLQSAWSKWVFQYDVHAAYIVDNTLTILFKRGTQYELATMDLGDDPENLAFNLYMDYRQTLTPDVDNKVTYALANGLTTADIVAVSAYDATHPGMELQVTDITGDVVTLGSSYGDVEIGVRFESLYEPTMPTYKDENGITISTDELMLGFFLISVADSYGYDFQVVSDYRDTTTQVVRTNIVGNFIIGSAVMKDATTQVSVLESTALARCIIRSDNPYPLNIIDIEYRGQFQKRGARV